jgi:hypothetical protein
MPNNETYVPQCGDIVEITFGSYSGYTGVIVSEYPFDDLYTVRFEHSGDYRQFDSGSLTFRGCNV